MMTWFFLFQGLWLISACTTAQDPYLRDCQEVDDCFADLCPGGSVAYSECEAQENGVQRCRFMACSSPIGTPCDGDPATVFENERCS